MPCHPPTLASYKAHALPSLWAFCVCHLYAVRFLLLLQGARGTKTRPAEHDEVEVGRGLTDLGTASRCHVCVLRTHAGHEAVADAQPWQRVVQ